MGLPKNTVEFLAGMAEEAAPVPSHPEINSGAVATLCKPSKRESDDDYAHVVVRVDDSTRVIGCADNLQWIVQRKRAGRWRSDSFCRTRKALIRIAGDCPELRALPEMHP